MAGFFGQSVPAKPPLPSAQAGATDRTRIEHGCSISQDRRTRAGSVDLRGEGTIESAARPVTQNPFGHVSLPTLDKADDLDPNAAVRLKSGWIVLACCWMPNQIHALHQTPEPNLASGKRHWVTGTDRVSNLVRRAEHRRRQSPGCQKTVQETEASLGLNTEHKARARRSQP